MRGVFEQIIAHPQGVDAASLREIQRYAKLFWINNGPYNNLTARKFVLNLTPQALAAAVKAATAAGATLTTPPGESVDAMLTRLGPMFFDANVDPIVTNKTPGPGRDILTASANNLYFGRQHGGSEGVHREIRVELAPRRSATGGWSRRSTRSTDGTARRSRTS